MAGRATCLLLTMGALALAGAGCEREPRLGAALVSAKPASKAPLKAALQHMPAGGSLRTEDFVTNAIGADLYAIKAAEIAAVRSHAPGVRAFAKAMAEDHAAARAELDEAVLRSGESLPVPNTPTDRQQALLHLLARDTAANFDKTYVEQQVQTHEEALRALSDYAKTGATPAIRAAAGDLAPKTQANLDKARAIEDALNAS